MNIYIIDNSKCSSTIQRELAVAFPWWQLCKCTTMLHNIYMPMFLYYPWIDLTPFSLSLPICSPDSLGSTVVYHDRFNAIRLSLQPRSGIVPKTDHECFPPHSLSFIMNLIWPMTQKIPVAKFHNYWVSQTWHHDKSFLYVVTVIVYLPCLCLSFQRDLTSSHNHNIVL